MSEMTSEMKSLKERLKKTWSSGDYGLVAKELESSAEEFLKRFPSEPGIRLLDVACGTGQIAFPAARAGARVTGLDIAPNLLSYHLKVLRRNRRKLLLEQQFLLHQYGAPGYSQQENQGSQLQ